MRKEFIQPAATLAAAFVQKQTNNPITDEELKALLLRCYRALEAAEQEVVNTPGKMSSAPLRI